MSATDEVQAARDAAAAVLAEAADRMNAERTRVAEGLLALAFSLRGSDGPRGQAWVLTLASAVTARAILASIGPDGGADELLTIVEEQTRKMVDEAQRKFFRDKLKTPPGKM